jgi:hypothetical protein
MKIRTICLALCLLVISVSLVDALPKYNIYDTEYRQGAGGPFQIVGNGMDFLTFCVETSEYISLSGSYWGSINDVVIYGNGNQNDSVFLDPRTVSLYNYFLDNQANPNLSANDKGQIQIAIWAFQGQTIALDNKFYSDPSYFNYNGSSRIIKVLNLWTADVGDGPYNTEYAYNHKAQSQLIAVPEPGILILLGIGLTSVALVARRKKLIP